MPQVVASEILAGLARNNGDELNLTAPIEWVEAKDAEPNALPTFKMLANTGKPMRVGGFYDPVIVSMKGARFAKSTTPIIMDHDTKLRLGHTTVQSIDVDNNKIVVSGVVSSTSAAAKEFVADSKNKFPFQSSIGATIKARTYVPEGKSVMVNGQKWDGPLIVADKTLIREVTACVLGADGDTETKVAASRKKPMPKELEAFIESLGLTASECTEEQVTKLTAKFEEHTKLLANQKPKPKAPASPPEKIEGTEDVEDKNSIAYRRKIEAQESERLDSITSLAGEYSEAIDASHEFTYFDEEGDQKKVKGLRGLKAAAIRTGMDANQFELKLLRASRATETNQPGIISKTSELEGTVLEAALCKQFSMIGGKNRWKGLCAGNENGVQGARDYGLEAYYKPDVLEKSDDKKYNGLNSIQALLEMQIRAAGKGWHSLSRGGSDFVAAAVDAWSTVRASGFSTLNIPNILENLMHKFALAAFDSQEQTWRAITGRKNLSDFRPHNMYRLNWDGHFRKVDQQGQLKHVSMKDSKYTVQADTYGAMITIDRKTIKNDDLGGIIAKATAIGMLGAMRIEQSVYTLLLSNPGSFFASGLNNFISGASSALSQTGASTPAVPAGLDKARKSFRNQVINGYPLNISPRLILGGTSMETQMYQIWKQETFAVAGTTGSNSFLLNNNEFQGMYRPVVSPYLNNTLLLDDEKNALSGQSDTQWFLFCDPNLPQGSALVIGFLDGRDQPFFDQADTQFNVPGGLQFRSYLDWGVNMNVYQLALKSAGA